MFREIISPNPGTFVRITMRELAMARAWPCRTSESEPRRIVTKDVSVMPLMTCPTMTTHLTGARLTSPSQTSRPNGPSNMNASRPNRSDIRPRHGPKQNSRTEVLLAMSPISRDAAPASPPEKDRTKSARAAEVALFAMHASAKEMISRNSVAFRCCSVACPQR